MRSEPSGHADGMPERRALNEKTGKDPAAFSAAQTPTADGAYACAPLIA